MDLHKREWEAYLNREKEGRKKKEKLGQGFDLYFGNLKLNVRIVLIS